MHFKVHDQQRKNTMKHILIAVSALVASLVTAGVASADDCKGNCHNFVTTALSGTWVRTASGGYVHDSSAVCDIVINFEYDSDHLTAEAQQTLIDNLDIVMYSGGVGFSDTGYASVEGSAEYNQNLSERRAAAVYHFLMDNGVDMDLITPVSGAGETDVWGPDLEDNRIVILSFNG
jgi:outer membrane protein OmpA-like peptidoglycan-associated protein